MREIKVEFSQNCPIRTRIYRVTKAPIHWHEGVLEIVFPLEGALEVTQNHEIFRLEPGDFTFVNSGCIHRLTSLQPEGSIAAVVSIDLLAYESTFENIAHILFRSQPLEGMSHDFKKSRAAQEARMLEALFQCVLRRNEPGFRATSPDVAYQQARHLLCLSMSDFFELFYKVGRYWFISDYQLQRYNRTVRYVHENCRSKISVTDILGRELISKTYFSQFWAKFSNQPFSEFLLMQRLTVAEKLLLSTDMCLEEISREAGFSAARYLYKYFLKCYNCKPLAYKVQCLDYQSGVEEPEVVDPSEALRLLNRYAQEHIEPAAALRKRLDSKSCLELFFEIRDQGKLAMEKNPGLDLREESIFVDLTDGKNLLSGRGEAGFNREHIIDLLTLVEAMDVIPLLRINYLVLKKRALLDDFLALLDELEEIFGVQRLKAWQYWLSFDTPAQQAEAAAYLARVRDKVGYSSAHLSIRLS